MNPERLHEKADDRRQERDVKAVHNEEMQRADMLEKLSVRDGGLLLEAERDRLDEPGYLRVVPDADREAPLQKRPAGSRPRHERIAFPVGENLAVLGIIAG